MRGKKGDFILMFFNLKWYHMRRTFSGETVITSRIWRYLAMLKNVKK